MSLFTQHVAHVEAVIDFGDEENIEPDVLEEGEQTKPDKNNSIS